MRRILSFTYLTLVKKLYLNSFLHLMFLMVKPKRRHSNQKAKMSQGRFSD